MLQTLFESAHDAIVIIDDTGRFVDANPAACQLFGVAREAVCRHTLDDFLGDAQFVRELVRGARPRGDLQIHTADGRAVAIEYRAKADFMPGRHLAILRDITDRLRVEHELRANAEFLRRLIESSHDCIKVLDMEGRLLSINEGGRRLLEMESVEPYVGLPWADFWMGGHVDRAAEALDAARRGEVARFEGYGGTIRGNWKWWETVIAPINDGSGAPERLLAVSRDITHRVEREREREAHHRRLQEVAAEASRQKDQFLATLAHELRNPLAAIMNGIATLDAIGAPTLGARTARGIIRRQTQHLANLLDDLLDVSRVAEGKLHLQPEPVDLGAVARAAVDGEAPRLEAKRQQVRVCVPAGPTWVRADPVRARQIAANLVNNACKYTPEGGTIDVVVESAGTEGVLRVHDTGIGIPPDRLEDVFGLFTQIEGSRGRGEGGLGIGLALVRRLATLQGGSVTAESAGPGRGSTFEVRLPLGPPPAAVASGPPSAERRRETIVLIEDDQDTRDLLAESLERAGHSVIAASSAGEGLAIVESNAPTVVITDIGLPDLDGFEVARRIRDGLGRNCLLVAFSGYGQPEDRVRATRAGFDMHVLKPADPESLLDLIASWPGRAAASPTRPDTELN